MLLRVAIDKSRHAVQLSIAEQQYITATRVKRANAFQQFREGQRRITFLDRHRRETEETESLGAFFAYLSPEFLNPRCQNLFMDHRMSGIHVFERPWRQHDRFFVEQVDRRHSRPIRGKIDTFSKTCTHQLGQNRALVPSFEVGSTHLRIVNFNASLNVLSNQPEKRFVLLQLKQNGVDQVHAQDADSLLMERVRSIQHIDMENDVVRLAARLQLEPQPNPTMRFICPRVVAGGDRIDKSKEASS